MEITMKIIVITIIILSLTTTSLLALGRKNSKINSLVKQLEDSKNADEAYIKLYNMGKDVIPFLIKNATSKKIFPGRAHINSLSSLLTDREKVGVISLYIIECILNQNLSPHLNAIILEKNKKFPTPLRTEDEIIIRAISAYKSWWKINKNKPLSQIIKEDRNPLRGTNLHWY